MQKLLEKILEKLKCINFRTGDTCDEEVVKLDFAKETLKSENTPVTGEELLNTLLIGGEYAGYDTHFSDREIYTALQKCKRLIPGPCSDNDIQCAYVSPLSARQFFCSESTVNFS